MFLIIFLFYGSTSQVRYAVSEFHVNLVLFLQKDDLKAVVDYLRADGNVSLIGLWGRSMGAVTRSLCFFFF